MQSGQAEITPYNPILQQTKQDVLDYLNMMSTCDSVIVGQNIGHADGSLEYGHMNNLIKSPGVLAVDLGYDDFSRDYSSLINEIENHWNNGGLISVSTHMPNPSNKKEIKAGKADYEKVITDGKKDNTNFKLLLNNIGNFLQELKNREIVVLFRPFHEMNGGWFWWGNNKNWPSQEAITNIWVYADNYFYTERQLDNLLWVYGPNFQYDDELKSVDYYYPGDAYVDVVGIDYYHDNLDNLDINSSLSLLEAKNKPVYIAEIGPSEKRDGTFDNLTYSALVNYPSVAYFVAWHSWPGNLVAIEDNVLMLCEYFLNKSLDSCVHIIRIFKLIVEL